MERMVWSAIGLVIMGLVIGALVLWLWMLIEAVRIPDSVWRAADQSKIVYVLLIIFLGLVGTLIYMLTARPALKRSGVS